MSKKKSSKLKKISVSQQLKKGYEALLKEYENKGVKVNT